MKGIFTVWIELKISAVVPGLTNHSLKGLSMLLPQAVVVKKNDLYFQKYNYHRIRTCLTSDSCVK